MAGMNTTTHQPAAKPVEACRNLFGEHPVDVISPINTAADAISWLEELFRTISKEALVESSGYRIKSLAEAGAYIASEIGNYAEHRHETMNDRLRAAGVIPAERGDKA